MIRPPAKSLLNWTTKRAGTGGTAHKTAPPGQHFNRNRHYLSAAGLLCILRKCWIFRSPGAILGTEEFSVMSMINYRAPSELFPSRSPQVPPPHRLQALSHRGGSDSIRHGRTAAGIVAGGLA